ncbi:MAG: hypothetical protein ABSD21_08495 [Rhizomicrobium sp.]|jgi:hypothetical protein
MKPGPLAVLAVFLLASFSAHAGAADDVVAAIAKCAALNDNTARLVCYDKIAGRSTTVEAAPQPQAAPPTQTAAAAPGKENEESWFGLDIGNWFGGGTSPARQTTPQQFGSENVPPPPAAPGAPPPPEPLDHITATVSDFAYNPFGRFIVFLDNGQIWQQLQGDTDQAHFSKHQKDQVTISRGLIGSYNLEIVGHNSLYKVKRIK